MNADPGSHVPHVTFHIPHAKLIPSHVAANARDVLDICTYTLSLHCGAHPGDGRRRVWPDAGLFWQQFVLCVPAVAQEHQVSGKDEPKEGDSDVIFNIISLLLRQHNALGCARSLLLLFDVLPYRSLTGRAPIRLVRQ